MSDVPGPFALCEFKKTDAGATFMGQSIRIDETGEYLSLQDCIVAIEGGTTNAAKLRLQKLVKEGKVKSDDTKNFSMFQYGMYKIWGGRIKAVAGLCGHLKGQKAEAISQHVTDNGVRVDAGDTALFTTIGENHKKVNAAAANGDGVAALLQKTRQAKEPERVGEEEEDLEWAIDRNKERYSQLVSNKQCIRHCHENGYKSPDVQDHLNQGPIGFRTSTKRFKRDHAIPQHHPVASFMTKDQLALRAMAQNKFVADTPDMSNAQAMKTLKTLRDKVTDFADFMGLSGFKKKRNFDASAIAIEAEHENMTRRQLKKELIRQAEEESKMMIEDASGDAKLEILAF